MSDCNPVLYSAFEEILKEAFETEFRKLGCHKLTELPPSFCTLDGALKESLKFMAKVERRLGFAQLTAQVRQHFGVDLVEKVCIVRDGVPEFSDFAVFENNIVPVYSSKFFLALIDASGKWNFSCKASAFRVKLRGEEFVFAPKETVRDSTELAMKLLDTKAKWWLFSADEGERIISEREKMASELREMNAANMKILATKKPVAVKSITLSCEEEKELYGEE